MEEVILICSGVIAATGSVTNALSLSYFARKAERSLCNRLFMMLNTFDLLVSVIDVAMVTLWYCKEPVLCGDNFAFLLVLAAFDFSVESSAFATCVLSVTRTVSLFFPFYQMQKQAVGIASLIFLVQEVLRLIFKFYFNDVKEKKQNLIYVEFDNGFTIVLLSMVTLVSLGSSLLSAWKLLGKRKKLQVAPVVDRNLGARMKTNQKATVTIIIVSILFCFFNSVFCVSLYFLIFGGRDSPKVRKMGTIETVLYAFSLWFAVPLNSAINPIIYFTRKKDMVKYLMELIPAKFLDRIGK